MSAHRVFYQKLRTKNTFFYCLCIFFIVVVALNIYCSQQYNNLMYGVMEGDNGATLSYLKHIWGTPLFNWEMLTLKTEGKDTLLSQWKQVEGENAQKIQTLEQFSLTHINSPEVYYNLFLLYRENGDNTRSQENLSKAQQLDPSLK